MPRHLTERQVIEILMLNAESVPKLQIAQQFNVSVSTINRKLATWRDEKRTGRKKVTRETKLNSEQIDRMKQLLDRDPFMNLYELKTILNLSVSFSTISRTCKKLSLTCGISPKKFYVKPVDCGLRVFVARRRLQWTVDYWKRIVFTDESGSDNSGFQRRYVRRPKNTRNDPKYTYFAPNRTLRVNYFSFCDKFGVGDLWFYKRMNSTNYCTIVHELIETLRERFQSDDFLIVHDNAKFAWSEQTVRFLRQFDYERYFVKIPPYSPDMNVIENLWALLKRKIRENCFIFGQSRGSRQRFEDLVDHCWSTISLDIVDNLYKSLPNRMRCVIESGGKPTRY